MDVIHTILFDLGDYFGDVPIFENSHQIPIIKSANGDNCDHRITKGNMKIFPSETFSLIKMENQF